MCGRYSLIADLGELAKRYEFDGDGLALKPAYNVAPTQDVLTVVGGETRRGGFIALGTDPVVGEECLHRKPVDKR